MANVLMILTDADKKLLQAVIDRERRRVGNTINRPRAEPELGWAPEVYVALAPAGGIPSFTDIPGTGSGSWDLPGTAECEIYKQVGGVLEPAGATPRTVFNLGPAVSAGTTTLIWRDKYGTWYAQGVAAHVGAGLVVYGDASGGLTTTADFAYIAAAHTLSIVNGATSVVVSPGSIKADNGSASVEMDPGSGFKDSTWAVSWRLYTNSGGFATTTLPGGTGGRVYAGGTAIATTDVSLSGGWGANAVVDSVSGNDTRGKIVVKTSVLDTPGANPTVTLTFKDGAYAAAPFAVACANSGMTGPVALTAVSTSTTKLILTYEGTPTATSVLTYVFDYVVIG